MASTNAQVSGLRTFRGLRPAFLISGVSRHLVSKSVSNDQAASSRTRVQVVMSCRPVLLSVFYGADPAACWGSVATYGRELADFSLTQVCRRDGT